LVKVNTMDMRIDAKISCLKAELKQYPSLAVAFSGGADSTLLLAVAREVISDDKSLVAVTAVSPIHPPEELIAAEDFTRKRGIQHITVRAGEMQMPAFTANTPDRCYICKQIVFSRIRDVARDHGIAHLVHGANADDGKDYRPGMKAAEELGFAAPLMAADLTKSDVREISRRMGLSTWNKPSSGCLATRIPYDRLITEKKLEMIYLAEKILSSYGFKDVRVRYYDVLAKIELSDDDFEKILPSKIRAAVLEKFRQIGFLFVSIDIEPYRSGRMNRSVPLDRRFHS
jgi:pyridinium-3,5-biscarboxylic acid mononucleotide sulfurtransferase